MILGNKSNCKNVRRNAVLWVAFSLCASQIAWVGNKLINVQGKLTDNTGAALSGTYTVTFRLYSNINDAVGSAVWSESQSVSVSTGLFAVALGTSTSLDNLPFNQAYYLGMQVAGDANELSPRQLLGASAYALGSLGDFNVRGELTVSTITAVSSASVTNLTATNLNTATLAINQLTITSMTVNSINGTFLGLGRNRIINGEMVLDQANAGNAVTVNSPTAVYSADQWKGEGTSSAGVFTLQQLSGTPPPGFIYYLRATATTASASPGASANYYFRNIVESNNIRDWYQSSSNSGLLAITLSFRVRSSLTGTFSGSIFNPSGSSNRSYPFTYSINSANTWETKTVSIVQDSTGGGTPAIGTGQGISLIFDLGSGSNSESSAGAWATGAFTRVASSVRLISTVNATLDVTGVQLELGTVATEFERPPFATLLQWCQRYYEKSYDIGTSPGTSTSANLPSLSCSQIGTTTMYCSRIWYKVQKRVNPTLSLWDNSGNSGKWKWTSTGGVTTSRTASTGDEGTQGFAVLQSVAVEYLGEGHFVADARF